MLWKGRTGIIAAIGLTLLPTCNGLVKHVDKSMMNQLAEEPPYEIDPAVRRLHGRLFVADAHADTLLWDRGGMENRNEYGHVDIPRLQEANVGFQILTVVTKSPLFLFSKDRCPPSIDKLSLLAALQGWPIGSWFSLRERAFYQAHKWRRLGEDARVVPILYREDLEAFVREHARGVEALRDRKIAMFLDKLPEGVWEIRYELRAEVPGQFHALPLLGHAMYVPEIRANGAETRLEVRDRAVVSPGPGLRR